jgi:hypothetical protein
MGVMVCPLADMNAKVLNIVGVLTIVNRGILEINEEGTKQLTLTCVEM